MKQVVAALARAREVSSSQSLDHHRRNHAHVHDQKRPVNMTTIGVVILLPGSRKARNALLPLRRPEATKKGSQPVSRTRRTSHRRETDLVVLRPLKLTSLMEKKSSQNIETSPVGKVRGRVAVLKEDPAQHNHVFQLVASRLKAIAADADEDQALQKVKNVAVSEKMNESHIGAEKTAQIPVRPLPRVRAVTVTTRETVSHPGEHPSRK